METKKKFFKEYIGFAFLLFCFCWDFFGFFFFFLLLVFSFVVVDFSRSEKYVTVQSPLDIFKVYTQLFGKQYV